MQLTFEVNFVDERIYQPYYCRNNPRKGVKHLRCFPACLPQGHRSTRFCGRPLEAEVRVLAVGRPARDLTPIWTDDLEFVGEFISSLEEAVDRTSFVTESWFDANLYTPQNPLGSLYKGTVISSYSAPAQESSDDDSSRRSICLKTLLIRFNENSDGAWQCGVKSSSRTRHSFRVSILRRIPEIVSFDEPDMMLEEIFHVNSPTFKIISARRLSSQSSEQLQLRDPEAKQPFGTTSSGDEDELSEEEY